MIDKTLKRITSGAKNGMLADKTVIKNLIWFDNGHCATTIKRELFTWDSDGYCTTLHYEYDEEYNLYELTDFEYQWIWQDEQGVFYITDKKYTTKEIIYVTTDKSGTWIEPYKKSESVR